MINLEPISRQGQNQSSPEGETEGKVTWVKFQILQRLLSKVQGGAER